MKLSEQVAKLEDTHEYVSFSIVLLAVVLGDQAHDNPYAYPTRDINVTSDDGFTRHIRIVVDRDCVKELRGRIDKLKLGAKVTYELHNDEAFSIDVRLEESS